MIKTTVMIALLAVSAAAFGQKKAKKAVAKQPVAEVVETKESINFDNLLPSTAKVTFVDSTILDKRLFVSQIPLDKSAGSVTSAQTKNGNINYTYTNSLNNLRILSQQDKNGHNRLYHQTKKGTNWGDPEPIEIPGGFTDIICPYVLSDGITLYFAARGGEDNVGGYDLFFTIFDTDDQKYITPQSIGLPFNSTADDLYYIIDEDTDIGYLVTNRRQKDDKVCIYSFIPTESRESYDIDDEAKLRQFAELRSIRATQTDKKAVAEARQRMARLSKKSVSAKRTVTFPLRKGVTYTKASDFKVAKARELYAGYEKRMTTLMENEDRLASLRKGYHNGQKYTADEILNLEESTQAERKALRDLAAQIRNLEIKK